MSLKNLKTSKKCYKKSPTSNAWATIFKNPNFLGLFISYKIE